MPYTDNAELQRAYEYVENTGTSVFLTGKAGTGKTTFLQHLRDTSSKTMVVLAPTGVAAINAGGVTMHSFFQLPTSPYTPGTRIKDKYNWRRDKLNIIRSLDLLVIDEISMVRADLLDAVDWVLRHIRRNEQPFGGVQLLMIGDLQQLSPVVTEAERPLLEKYYESPYFFASLALRRISYVTVTLTQVFRQQDQAFVNLLNHVRDSQLTPRDLDVLASRLQPDFVPPSDQGYVRLTTHNNRADAYNRRQLAALNSRPFAFDAKVEGNFPDSSYPTQESLELKKGSQVMFLKNDPEGRFYNGLVGTVTEIGDDTVTVTPVDGSVDVDVEPMEWENVRYTVNEATGEINTDVQGTFTQLPLRLAWAITIHKSQGLTFDHIVIDAGASFSPGQAYVALSRCRTLDGVVLVTPFTQSILYTDNTVQDYLSHIAQDEDQSIRLLPAIKQEYTRALLLDLFNYDEVGRMFDSLCRLVSSNFGKMHPEINAFMAAKNVDWRSDVIEVAHKWGTMLRQTPAENLLDDALVQRVSRGAKYFAGKFLGTIGPALLATNGIRSNNKMVMKRLRESASDLNLRAKAIYALLNQMGDQPFTPDGYLKAKRTAALTADQCEWPREARTNLPKASTGVPRKRKNPKLPKE